MHALLLLLLLAPAHGARDRDADGVIDKLDACPGEPEDLDAFEDADGCPDLDDDRDGLRDAEDACPREPEDRDGFEDGDGCPEPDNDRDGLLDAVDACPLLAGAEEHQGCPGPAPPILEPFTAMEAAVRVGDERTFRRAWAKSGYDANLVGPSGARGAGVYAQARDGAWYLRPRMDAIRRHGEASVWVVGCDVQPWDGETALDAVFAVLGTQDDAFVLFGLGASEREATALAERVAIAQEATDADAGSP